MVNNIGAILLSTKPARKSVFKLLFIVMVQVDCPVQVVHPAKTAPGEGRNPQRQQGRHISLKLTALGPTPLEQFRRESALVTSFRAVKTRVVNCRQRLSNYLQ
jgi:hypothetical protein